MFGKYLFNLFCITVNVFFEGLGRNTELGYTPWLLHDRCGAIFRYMCLKILVDLYKV